MSSSAAQEIFRSLHRGSAPLLPPNALGWPGAPHAAPELTQLAQNRCSHEGDAMHKDTSGYSPTSFALNFDSLLQPINHTRPNAWFSVLSRPREFDRRRLLSAFESMGN
jgi:hypothetical protein